MSFTSETERTSALRRTLGVIDVSERRSMLDAVASELAGIVDGVSVIYRLAPGLDGWGLDFINVHGMGLENKLPPLFHSFLRGSFSQWTSFDPLRPEPDQRNTLVGPRAMEAILNSAPVASAVYEPLGIRHLPHMRVLLCDGPLLLGWVGIWARDPISRRDERSFASLIEPLRRRLRIERSLNGATSLDAIAAALDNITAPAFLMRRSGSIEVTNEAGRLLFNRSGSALLSSLQQLMLRPEGANGATVTPLNAPGSPSGGALIVLRADGVSSEARLALLRVRWGLTPRQTAVLALLAYGDANKDIATKLRCALRTVDIHVSSLLAKARVDSRAQLVARFWTAT